MGIGKEMIFGLIKESMLVNSMVMMCMEEMVLT